MSEYEQQLHGVAINQYDRENPPQYWQIVDTAILYANVFAGSPWYEVNRCPSCESYYGPDSVSGSQCENCNNAPIEPAYPMNKMISQISSELEKQGAKMFLAEFGGEIVGFAWTHMRKTEEYLPRFKELSPEVATKMEQILSRQECYYSLAEIGVAQSMRGRGIGKQLFILQTESGAEHGLTQVVWTRCDTKIPLFSLKHGFTQVFGPEVVLENGKAKLTGRDLIGRNPTAPERVLFLK